MRGTLTAALVAASFSHSINAKLLELTEAELRAYEGSDKEKPIYIAIDGTVFDVSIAPSFYGPGGHYNHFAGRDATRAWVTECWDTEDQLTWRMDDIEETFMPKYLDELILSYTGDGAGGDLAELIGVVGKEAIQKMADTAEEKFGKLTAEEIQKRREEDLPEAKEKVRAALAHWYKFFSENPKYNVAGKVVRDIENTPAPPKPCEAALKRRAVKGGKMDGLMNIGNMGGAQAAAGKPGKPGKPSGEQKPKNNKNKKAKKEKKEKAEL